MSPAPAAATLRSRPPPPIPLKCKNGPSTAGCRHGGMGAAFRKGFARLALDLAVISREYRSRHFLRVAPLHSSPGLNSMVVIPHEYSNAAPARANSTGKTVQGSERSFSRKDFLRATRPPDRR